MPTYTLYYFNGRGRAEISRMLFAAAAVPYIDKRIDFTEWSHTKTTMPGSILPILEIDNRIMIPQSMSISRYLAREFGFHGKNNLDMLKVEYITDCFYDILEDFMRIYYNKDGKMVPSFGSDMINKSGGCTVERRSRFIATCDRILPFLERTLKMVDGGNMYFLGEQMLMCDIMCFATFENPLREYPELLNDYPKLRSLRNRIISNPRISAYIQKRDNTDF